MADRIIRLMDQEVQRNILGDRLSMYENDWDVLLEKELHKQFVTETAERIKLMLDTSMNIFRRIIRDICTVYKENAKRQLSTGDSERWDEINKSLQLDVILGEAHRLSKACTISFLHVRAIPGTEKLRVSIITPDQAHVETDGADPLMMKSFSYCVREKDKNGKEIEAWVYYDNKRMLFLNASGERIGNPFNDTVVTGENKYGLIPVVPFHCTHPVNTFFRVNWNKDAYRANMIIGVLNTYMNYLVKTQSFKQITLTGTNISEQVKNGILDPSFPLALDEGATAGTLDLNTQLGAIDAVIRGKVAAIANNYGISNENFTLTGQPASGFSLRVANRSLEEIRQADIPLCAEVEKALYKVIARINNSEFPGRNLPENAEIIFNPGEVEYPLTWEEQEKRWNFEFTNGIANAVDYLIYKDPQITREEAEKRLVALSQENSRLKPKLSLAETLLGGINA